MAQQGSIVVLRDGHVVTLELCNPARRNAISTAMLAGLEAELDAIAADDAVHAVVLTGTGGHFCSGYDLASGEGHEGALASADLLVRLAERVRSLPVLVVAAVQGAAYGAGLGIALSCDVRIAARSARFCMPVVALGGAYPTTLVGSIVSAVGVSRMVELFATGRVLGADEAVGLGLAQRVVDDIELDAEVAVLARTFAASPPLSVAHLKRQAQAFRAAALPDPSTIANLEAALPAIVDSADAREARAGFLEKRTATFTGR